MILHLNIWFLIRLTVITIQDYFKFVPEIRRCSNCCDRDLCSLAVFLAHRCRHNVSLLSLISINPSTDVQIQNILWTCFTEYKQEFIPLSIWWTPMINLFLRNSRFSNSGSEVRSKEDIVIFLQLRVGQIWRMTGLYNISL